MSATGGPAPEPAAPLTCDLCGQAVPVGAARCPACGLAQVGGPERPNPFSRPQLLLLGAVFVAVYVVALLAVVIAR